MWVSHQVIDSSNLHSPDCHGRHAKGKAVGGSSVIASWDENKGYRFTTGMIAQSTRVCEPVCMLMTYASDTCRQGDAHDSRMSSKWQSTATTQIRDYTVQATFATCNDVWIVLCRVKTETNALPSCVSVILQYHRLIALPR